MTALVNSSGKFSDIYWIKKYCLYTRHNNKQTGIRILQKFPDKKEDYKQKKYLIRERFGHFHR